MKLAVIGATGLVGRKIIQVLEEKRFPIDEFVAVASKNSAGQNIKFRGDNYRVITIEEGLYAAPDIAIFSAGAEISKKWAKKFAKKNCFVIDNSSTWRMDETVPLVIPEINASTISSKQKIIANPNCSTIQLLMALSPLHIKYKIKRVVVSTYQSVSGSGAKGIQQLSDERQGKEGDKAYPHQIDMNVIPHAGDFSEDGYSSEETKLVNETKKILDPSISVTATAVRVPVEGGHSEAVNLEFENDFEIFEVKRLLGTMPGVVVLDMPEANFYPMPIMANGKNEVFVGRIRRDLSQPNSLNIWIVSDNLRKGAATNAVQIAEYLLKQGFID